MNDTQQPDPIQPGEVERLIGMFKDLEVRAPREFAQAVAENIREPDPAETLALRSEELAPLTLVACRFLIDQTQSVLNGKRKGTPEYRNTETFLINVGRERRLVQSVVDGIRAKKGILPNAPNPRGRAMRRLATENLQGDVPKGRFRELLLEEQEVDRERKRREKEERKQRRREARAATGDQPAPRRPRDRS